MKKPEIPCRGGGVPRPPAYDFGASKIGAEVCRPSEESLPLEGKALVRLKPDRMRSKVTASYRPMVMIGSFDLISQP